jgi:carbamoyl-phosphate synthase large subunit
MPEWSSTPAAGRDRRTNILILSAGRRVELLEGFKAAAASLSPRSKVLAADLHPQMSAACMIADAAFELPRVTAEAYGDALQQLCRSQEVGIVVPTIDTELKVLADLKASFAAEGTHLIISAPNLVGECRDKRLTGGLFQRLGLCTPRIYPADCIEFPCFSKPLNGSSSVGAMRVDGPQEITTIMLADPERIYMELVPDSYQEVTVDLYFDRNNRLKAAVPRDRVETRAGESSKGVTRRDWVYDHLKERLAVVEGAAGPLTLQLFVSDESRATMAIEINPRFGGGYPLSLAAGADFPAWLIQEYLLGQEVGFFEAWEKDLMMLRYDAKVLRHRAR